ncbi:MAG: ABC transporter permease, partial [Gemmatimonadales bacterium]
MKALRELLTPPSRLELRIARRYLQGRRSSGIASLNTVIAAGGVAVGVMALIVVLGVMNGLRDDLRERILVASPHLRVLTYGSGLRMDDWEAVAARVREDPDVVSVAPEVLTESIINAGADYYEGVQVLGYAHGGGDTSVTSLPEAMISGDLSLETDREDVDGAVVLGERLAERIGVVPGDEVTLVSPAGAKVNRALGAAVPRYFVFEVTGLFDTGMFLYDNKFVVMDLAVAQRFAGLGDAVTGLSVRVTDPWEAPAVGLRVEDRLGYPYRSLDWQAQNSTLFGALQLEKLAMGLIIFFIMIVAAFNIVG